MARALIAFPNQALLAEPDGARLALTERPTPIPPYRPLEKRCAGSGHSAASRSMSLLDALTGRLCVMLLRIDH